MKLKQNFKLVISITSFIIALFFFICYFYLNYQFNKRIVSISQNIATSITAIEEEMVKTLNASALLVQEKFINEKPFTQEKLTKLAKDLEIGTISILNGSDGLFFMTSGKVFLKEDPGYKDFSVTNIKQCETQMCGEKLCRSELEIKNCKMKRTFALNAISNPDNIYEIPMYNAPIWGTVKTKIPAKWVIVYNKKLNKIFDLFYSGTELNKILENNLKTHNEDLTYINISDNTGNIIAEFGKKSKYNKSVTMPFGKVWNFSVEGKNTEYSYILYTEFSLKDLIYHIIILIISFLLIAILLIFLIVMFKVKIFSNEKGIDLLKNIIYENQKKVK